jgi:hypothetical protein
MDFSLSAGRADVKDPKPRAASMKMELILGMVKGVEMLCF